jgi:hypothetical protein
MYRVGERRAALTYFRMLGCDTSMSMKVARKGTTHLDGIDVQDRLLQQVDKLLKVIFTD